MQQSIPTTSCQVSVAHKLGTWDVGTNVEALKLTKKVASRTALQRVCLLIDRTMAAARREYTAPVRPVSRHLQSDPFAAIYIVPRQHSTSGDVCHTEVWHALSSSHASHLSVWINMWKLGLLIGDSYLGVKAGIPAGRPCWRRLICIACCQDPAPEQVCTCLVTCIKSIQESIRCFVANLILKVQTEIPYPIFHHKRTTQQS